MKKEPAFVAGTLRWCNSQRKKQGKTVLKKLPRGYQGDPYSCPCGAATGLHVGTTKFRKQDDPVFAPGHRLPECVITFVEAFDDGRLPQYDKKMRTPRL